ncbi:hypothetical protein L596_026526 [Steinernema carpocapsae]|uniref:Uncharacterized protein n=1 Tax=Steinernema carpocapsae TaxID=34508 RepID=A0A4U5M1S1_STECR|nr:hypothetical protein L596_026526 [Steinernema carpocapsae]
MQGFVDLRRRRLLLSGCHLVAKGTQGPKAASGSITSQAFYITGDMGSLGSAGCKGSEGSEKVAGVAFYPKAGRRVARQVSRQMLTCPV